VSQAGPVSASLRAAGADRTARTAPTAEEIPVERPFLIGSKIYLRPIEMDDIPLMCEWVNHPDVTRTLRIWRPMSSLNEREFVEHVSRSPNDLATLIVVRATDRPIGTCGLMRIDWVTRQAGFGIGIGAPKEWGKGYGSEATRLITDYAFGTVNLNRVWLEVYADHPAARRAYEKAGFRLEGTQRQAAFQDGRYIDVHLMSVLRSEWEAARARGARPGVRSSRTAGLPTARGRASRRGGAGSSPGRRP
jgi:RimJ/RimL family protein N-acetyltransferase